MALAVPVMDTGRARATISAGRRATLTDALLELLDGLRDGAGHPTPPLDPATSGPLRLREIRSGIGGTST